MSLKKSKFRLFILFKFVGEVDKRRLICKTMIVFSLDYLIGRFIESCLFKIALKKIKRKIQ